jgi:hypothetical protein
MTVPNFNSFLFNTLLVNEFILLNPRSYIRKEINTHITTKKETDSRWVSSKLTFASFIQGGSSNVSMTLH